MKSGYIYPSNYETNSYNVDYSLPDEGVVPSSLNNGLIHYWKLDEVSGSRANSVTPTWPMVAVASEPGKHNLGCTLNIDGGVGVSERAGSQLGSGSYSVSLWVYWFSISGAQLFVVNVSGKLPREVRHDGGVYNFSLWDSSFNHSQANGPAPSGGVWQHILAWFDTDDMKAHISVDGVETTAAVALVDLADAGTCSITTSAGDFSVHAVLDEIAVWNRVLSAPEKVELYNAGAGKFYPF